MARLAILRLANYADGLPVVARLRYKCKLVTIGVDPFVIDAKDGHRPSVM